MAITSKLRSDLAQLNQTLSKVTSRQNDYLEKNQVEQAQNLNTQITGLNTEINQKNKELNDIYQSPGSTVKISDNTLVGTDQAELDSFKKYQSSTILGDTSQGEQYQAQRNKGFPQPGVPKNNSVNSIERGLATIASLAPLAVAGTGLVKKLLPGAKRNKPTPASVTVKYPQGGKKSEDLRVKIIVPRSYLEKSEFPYLYSLGGIIFPYTPQITVEQGARYTEQSPVHSNYPLNFYKNSYVGSIGITGKFTVQSNSDALYFLSTMQLLRSITKMKWGDDTDAGSPPPVCRLSAYGTYMLQNIPVAITSFRQDFPEGVDYFTFDPTLNTEGFTNSRITSIPTSCTITINCVPMFSRNELKNFSLDKFVSSYTTEKTKGYI